MGQPKRAPSRSAGGGEPLSRSLLLPLALFLALALLLYGNTLRNGFVNDDKPLVANNALVNDASRLGDIFTSGYWSTRQDSVPELYRPLTVLSLALNRRLTGAAPSGFHLVNLLLHGCVSFFVFRIALSIGTSRAAAWAAGLIFAVHPVHTEAVAPVVGRSELLAALFFLAALKLHHAIMHGKGGASFAFGAASCYLAASLSKEGALIFPAIALLTDIAFPPARAVSRRARAAPFALYALAALLVLGIRYEVLGAVARSDIRPLDNPLVALPPGAALSTALVALGGTLKLLVYPLRLSADYAGTEIRPAAGLLDPRVVAVLALIFILVAAAALAWTRLRSASWGIAFLLIAILPVSNLFFLIGTIFGERLLYLPSAGFCVAAGALWGEWRGRSKMTALAAAVLVLLAGSARTVARNSIWQDDGTFALATSRDAPSSPKAQFNWGVFLEEHSDARAEAAYREAARLAPDWSDPRYNLAGILAASGRLTEAIEEYRAALAIRPDDARAVLNLGYALYRAGRHPEAVELYQRFLKERGESAPVLNSLGANLLAMARRDEAVAAFQRAVQLAPGEPGYRQNLEQALKTSEETPTPAP
ncbi:MAG TPA: tetratricopeptide repeat protein [Candidatus Polarisedimenticolia bacterium]|nr:tetratricopeptide repeat protein [Candidatus Polarisedimenticolia bacterium]